jgi:hypothetical protein
MSRHRTKWREKIVNRARSHKGKELAGRGSGRKSSIDCRRCRVGMEAGTSEGLGIGSLRNSQTTVFSMKLMVTFTLLKVRRAGCRWLTPVVLATQEAEIRRITVRSQPRQIVCEPLSQKKTHL